MEYRTSVSGSLKRRRTCWPDTLSDHIRWIYSLEIDRKKVLGVGQASGMFPIDTEQKNYRKDLAECFDQLTADKNIRGRSWRFCRRCWQPEGRQEH